MNEVVVVYACERPSNAWHASVFLAGPTSHDRVGASWRAEAVIALQKRWDRPGTLVVFVPEVRPGQQPPSNTDWIEWERSWTNASDVLLFWMSDESGSLSTANVEWGRHEASGRVVLGHPASAAQLSYLRHFADLHQIPVCETLEGAAGAAAALLGDGAYRCGGQRDVPLLVWRAASFQAWLGAQQRAGNELRGARLEWTMRVGPVRFLLFWALHVQVWVAAEQRLKANEVVLSRPDICTVLAYRPAPHWLDTEVVLAREFRSPSTSADGFVRELPGGSGFKPQAPIEQAVAELREETSLEIAAHRIRVHAHRQPAATLSAHRLHLFSAELSADEIAGLRADTGMHGNLGETEQTYVEVRSLRDLLTSHDVDWVTLGAIFQVLADRSAGPVPQPCLEPVGGRPVSSVLNRVFFARSDTTYAETAQAENDGQRVVLPWTVDPVKEAAWDAYFTLTFYILPVLRSGVELSDGELSASWGRLREEAAQVDLRDRLRQGRGVADLFQSLPAEPGIADLQSLTSRFADLAELDPEQRYRFDEFFPVTAMA